MSSCTDIRVTAWPAAMTTPRGRCRGPRPL